MKVSVIMPTYKRPVFLERSIGSVVAQTHADWELLVVDDNGEASNYQEETERFMERYEGEPRIHYLKRRKNGGAPAARNTGLRHATGDYVAFLDDDDAWLPDKLEKQVAAFQRGGDRLALVYTGLKVVNGRGEVIKIVVPRLRGAIYKQLFERNHVHTPSSVMCRKDALFKIGLFDETLPPKEDLDLYLRLARHYDFDFVAEPLTIYAVHDRGRLTENVAALLRAHDKLYAKYADDLKRDRRLHSHFLHKQGYLLMKAGDIRRARDKFIRSLSANPLNRRSLKALLRLGFKRGRPSLS